MDERAVPRQECSRRCLVAGSVGLGLAGPVLIAASAEAAGKAVIATSKVPVGGGVVVADRGVVVTQPKAGRFRVFTAVCTHEGCTVGEVTDQRIVCPCHGSQFAIGSGKPVAGPAQTPLAKKAFTIKKGKIFLD